MPGGSKTDPLLAKAEPISDSGSASVRTYLRRLKKNPAVQQQPEERMRTYDRNNSAYAKVGEEGGGESAPGTGAEIPLEPMVKIMVGLIVPLQPMEVNSGVDIHSQPMEDPTSEQLDD
ncbi:protein pxr1-like [Limosa lapponica baueri]|uniref:Protein pxr1-like n=1 Tax=Limosa lapponica baueri TaxID=1758121 RepID=A0A2I0ULP2_LIMLA|nr:protein pxr1-like [Limosa lapponica baueri]